jgi:hypothetical protein
MLCGLTDGNYAQDQEYRFDVNPWLVDFDLRKMHDLCCNFGMGAMSMFYANREVEATDSTIDRFLAASVAFGHTGFLVLEGGFENALRSYYMLQQLHARYALSSVEEIRYADDNGHLLETTAAIATGAYALSQVVVRYANGCITVVNGNPVRRMVVEAYGRELDIPPNGYAGWTEDGEIEVISSDPDGHRCDYASTPAYIYIDGRGHFTHFPRAASDGISICRILGSSRYEIIPYNGAECGFAIDTTKAIALDEDRNIIGPAGTRVSRGLTYIIPVEGALSYILEGDEDKE